MRSTREEGRNAGVWGLFHCKEELIVVWDGVTHLLR